MKVEKDKVIKDIPENLVSLYQSMGWKLLKNNTFKSETKKFRKPSEETTDEN